VRTITFIQKNRFEVDGQPAVNYDINLPLELIEALKQRKFLPQTPYLHWRRISRLYYVVTLGDKRGIYMHLWKFNETSLPNEVVQEVEREEQRSGLEANAIIWTITRWHGRTVALARILLGYGTNIYVESNNEEITLTPQIRYYMQLKGRTILYWKQLGEDTWLITKSAKDYDAKSWLTCETLKIPKKFRTFNYYMFLETTINLTEKDGKPALVLKRTVFRSSFDEFLDNTIKKGKGKIEIHDLYNLYLEYIKKNKPEEEPLSFIGFLDKLNPRIIPTKPYKVLREHPEETYYIHGFSLKTQTNERGDDG
jgi:hypothetical protein